LNYVVLKIREDKQIDLDSKFFIKVPKVKTGAADAWSSLAFTLLSISPDICVIRC